MSATALREEAEQIAETALVSRPGLPTRRPTGEAGWPNLLIEGKEGAGKTFAALRLSADPRVGTTFVIEVGERRADEYAALGEFLIVEHDGTIRGVTDAIRQVMLQPPEDGKPNVMVIDSMTGVWDLVKREAERIARNSKSARETLSKDPDAQIDVKHQAWNKAKDPYWWGWLNQLRAWPGIALLTARADEVSKFVDGRPVAGQTEYRVELESGTPFILDATVRMRLAKPPLVTTAKSLNFAVPEAGLPLEEGEPLAQLVFGLFGAGTEVLLDTGRAKGVVMARVNALGLLGDDAKKVCAEAWKKAGNRTRFDGAAIKELLDAAADLVRDFDPDPASGSPEGEPDG
jgi:hypothetical protein